MTFADDAVQLEETCMTGEAPDPPAAPAAAMALTVLGSGSSGNASVISHGKDLVLIDAGFSCKEILRRMALAGLDPHQLRAVLLTHEHGDHTQSVHTVSRRFGIPVYSTNGSYEQALSGKKLADWQALVPGRSVQIGPFCIHPISLPHDAADPVGFRVECGGRVLGHMTDFGYVSGLVRESLRGCDTLLVEANHDLDMLKEGPYPWPLKQRIAGRLGHLSNEAFLELLPDILHDDVGHLVVAHMSHTNNDARLLTLRIRQTLRRIGLPKLPFTIAAQDQPMETLTV